MPKSDMCEITQKRSEGVALLFRRIVVNSHKEQFLHDSL